MVNLVKTKTVKKSRQRNAQIIVTTEVRARTICYPVSPSKQGLICLKTIMMRISMKISTTTVIIMTNRQVSNNNHCNSGQSNGDYLLKQENHLNNIQQILKKFL